jgi:hypothetical protein
MILSPSSRLGITNLDYCQRINIEMWNKNADDCWLKKNVDRKKDKEIEFDAYNQKRERDSIDN